MPKSQRKIVYSHQLLMSTQELEKTVYRINPEIVIASSNLEPTDNLILNCILNHSTEVKVLLSGNSNDSGKREVQAALQDVGINHYFASTETFLNWLN